MVKRKSVSLLFCHTTYLFTLTVHLESEVAVNPAFSQGEYFSTFTAKHLMVHLIFYSPVLSCANYSIENIHLMDI